MKAKIVRNSDEGLTNKYSKDPRIIAAAQPKASMVNITGRLAHVDLPNCVKGASIRHFELKRDSIVRYEAAAASLETYV